MAYELQEDARRVLDPWLKRQKSAEKFHANYRRKTNHFYSLYRSHAEFRRWYQTAGESERDTGLKDAQREWGAELFIPFSFEVVETILPRMVSNRPRMQILPRKDTPEENAEAMRLIMEAQQEQIAYEMILQETAKSGLIYGLGVEKHYWRTDLYPMPVLERGISAGPDGKPQMLEATRMCGHDDPDCENVDILDFFSDPFSGDLRRARWAIHRTWRDSDYITKMLITGKWNNPFGVPPSEISTGGGSQHFDTAHKDRLEAQGHSDFSSGDDMRHEVWECHLPSAKPDQQVVTIINRKYIVQMGMKPNPFPGVPFVAYRPTTQGGVQELWGIGEIEPMEHLQHEMNAMRSLRMDNAKFAVNRTYFYTDGALDPDEVKTGPGMMNPVLGVDPREAIFALPVNDLPGSSYQEEDRLLADIQRVTGISDTVTGASSAGETATGVQMVQAAANVRIQNKTHRLEVEAIGAAGRIWLALNQWRIRNNREVMIPAPPEPGEAERKWAQRTITPQELAGEMFVSVEGGSTAPENPGEKMQRAQVKQQLYRGDPTIDQRILAMDTLRELGVRQPESWLAPEGPDGIAIMQVLEEIGKSGEPIELDRETLLKIVEQADLLKQQEGQQAQGGQPQTEPPA